MKNIPNPELAYEYYKKASIAEEGAREITDFLLNTPVLNRKDEDLNNYLDIIFK